MPRTLEFEFEELPLIIDLGFDAAIISGMADISYHADGEWFVSAIYVDGYRERSLVEKTKMRGDGLTPTSFEKKLVEVEHGSWMFGAIDNRLECEWREKVQNAVNEAIGEDRAHAADNAADYRRDVMRGAA